MCRQRTCLASRLLICEELGVIEKQRMERQPLKFKRYYLYFDSPIGIIQITYKTI